MPSYHTRLFLCLAGEGFYSFLLVGEGWMGGKHGIGDSPAFNPTLALPRLTGRGPTGALTAKFAPNTIGRGSQDLGRYRLCPDA
jgi:hypothetical protein